MDSIHTAFLLFVSITWTESQEIRHAAVSSNITFCFKPCTHNSVYKIYHGGVITHILCGYKYQIARKFDGRIRVDEATGCVTLCNVTRSDGGLYALEHKNGNGRKEMQRQITYVLHDKVGIRALSRNDTDGNISLTVACAGDPDTITWMDGGDLTAGYWLGDDNRTLTIPQDITGTVTVHVSNLVSTERMNITLINDANVKNGYIAPIMCRNISRVIWSDGGGQPGNQTLILPRNVTNIYVLTRSANNEGTSEVHPSRDRKLVSIPIIFIMPVAIFGVVAVWRRKDFHKNTGSTAPEN